MTTLFVEGKTIHTIEDLGKNKLQEILSKIFPRRNFKDHGKQFLINKLKRVVTNDKKESLTNFNYTLEEQ